MRICMLYICVFLCINNVISAEDMKDFVFDCHGNKYRIVTVGKQQWMAENLRSFSYDTQSPAYGKDLARPNGENGLQPLCVDATDNNNWGLRDPNPNYVEYQVPMYGCMYNWYAAVGKLCEDKKDCNIDDMKNAERVQGICPNGWHIPSHAEWMELIDYVESENGEGTSALMLKATDGWRIEWKAGRGVDKYGFTALPSGYVKSMSGPLYTMRCVYSVGCDACLWTSSLDDDYPYSIQLYCSYDYINSESSFMEQGCSVRCIKD